MAPPEWLAGMALAFERKGWPLYAVGGWVRDGLLGYAGYDVDLCGPVPPDTILEGLRGEPDGVGAVPAAPALGTLVVSIRRDGRSAKAEYTAFRRESYARGGAHRPLAVTLGATLREDALRRDFTVNAIYMRLPSGDIEDPLSGIPDLRARLLRTVRPPGEVFGDDGLRLLRLVRTACELGFGIDPPALSAAGEHAGHLRDIAPERIWAELQRMLLSDRRYPGLTGDTGPVERALRLMGEIGVLSVVLPETEACRGVPMRDGSDLLDHLVRSCALSPPQIRLRMSALLHDAGIQSDGGITDHAEAGARLARRALCRLRAGGDMVKTVARLVENHAFDACGQTPETEVRRFFAFGGYSFARDLVAIRRADGLAGAHPGSGDPAARWERILARMAEQGVPDSPGGVALNGHDLMVLTGEPPSPRVGRLKEALWRHVIDHPERNNRNDLAREAQRLIRRSGQWDTSGQGGNK